MCTTFYTLFLLYLWIRRLKGNGQGLGVGLNVRKWNGLIWKVWIAKTIEIKHHLCSCWDLCSSGWRVLFSENNAFLCIHFFCVYDVQKYFFFGVWWLLATIWSLWLNPRNWTVCISGQRQRICSHNCRNITVKTGKKTFSPASVGFITKRFAKLRFTKLRCMSNPYALFL